MLRCSKDASLRSSSQEQRNSNVDLGRWATQQLLKQDTTRGDIQQHERCKQNKKLQFI